MRMSKYILGIIIIVWFVIVLEFTANTLLQHNRLIYYAVTIPLLVIPVEIIKHFIYKKN